jgi:hypothetical protein
LLRGSSWLRLFPDIYVHVDAFEPDDHRLWCDAVALMLGEGAAIDGLSAAFLHGVDLLDRGSPVTVSVPQHRWRPRSPRLVTRRAELPPTDLTSFGRIPLTTPARTAFDLARRLDRTAAVVALDALCHRRLVTVRQVERRLDASAGPGTRRCREALMLVEPRCESPMETRLRLLLIDAGAPPPVAQYEVHDGAGRLVGRVDLAYPQWRIAIEYEGDHHRERAQFRRDIGRINDLHGQGWLVLRFTADGVLRHPGRVVRHVARAIQARRA